MPPTLDEIRGRLDALDASAFDGMNASVAGAEELYALMEQVPRLPDPRQAIPWLFRFLERLHTSDLGSPGARGSRARTYWGLRLGVGGVNSSPADAADGLDGQPHVERGSGTASTLQAPRAPARGSTTPKVAKRYVLDARDFLDYQAE